MKPTSLILTACMTLVMGSCTKYHKNEKASSDQSQATAYACPMHPEVTGTAGDSCSKCGMKLEKTTSGDVSMKMTTQPQRIERGQPVSLVFEPVIDGDVLVSELEEVHERKLHVIVVSNDLSWFDHIHPEPDGKGAYQVNDTFPSGGDFIVYADYKPEGHPARTDKFNIHVNGEQGKPVDLKPNLTSQTDGYQLSIALNNLQTGTLEIPISVIKDGIQLKKKDIQNYLGAVAHIILVDRDEKNFMHIHPGSTEHYPIVAHAEIAKPGLYRMWVQFQTNGTVHTAAFTLEVTSSATPEKSHHHHAH